MYSGNLALLCARRWCVPGNSYTGRESTPLALHRVDNWDDRNRWIVPASLPRFSYSLLSPWLSLFFIHPSFSSVFFSLSLSFFMSFSFSPHNFECTGLLGVMTLWNIQMNGISLVNLAMVRPILALRPCMLAFCLTHYHQCIGISVEFCVHICESFNKQRGTRDQRVQYLRRVGRGCDCT